MTRGRARGRSRDDEGATMVLVLLVTTLCMIYVTASAVAATSSIRPSRSTADSMAALAAAQAGLEVLTVAVEKCGTVALGCTAINGTTAVAIAPADLSASRATYRWTILEAPEQNVKKLLRMEVTGQVRDASRTLVADFETTGSLLTYAMFTDVETVGPETLATYYGPRTVALPDSTIRAKSDIVAVRSLTSVTWPGSSNTDICRAQWFNSTAYGTGRATLRSARGLVEGVDYTEATTTPGGTSAITRQAACEVAYGTGFLTTGSPDFAKVYSRDAMYLSNLIGGGAGPRFQGSAVTEWGTTSVPAPGTPGKWYRSDAKLGGDPEAGYTLPTLSTSPLALPAPVTGIEAKATCVFTGPTRIVLSATATTTTATVTSPGTASLPTTCTTGVSDATLDGAGLKQVPIPVTSATVFYVKDGATIAAANAATNPMFFLQKLLGTAIQTGQPVQFYNEMGVSESDYRGNVAPAPRTQALNDTLDPLFAQLNSQVPDGIGKPSYQTDGVTTYSSPIPSIDGLYEPVKMSTIVTRKVCTRMNFWKCTVYGAPVNAFTYSRELYSFPQAKDVTPYKTGQGTAFVEGAITGNLTIVAARDIVMTENTSYTNTESLLGLVAGVTATGTNPGVDVEIYHPVACRATSPATAPGGTCPNDLTGLYSTKMSTASLGAANPAAQYTELLGTDLKSFDLAATILTPTGALSVQNAMRGAAQFSLTVTGGVYEHYRGLLASYWGPAITDRTGYVLSLQYDPTLRTRQPPQFSTTTIAPGASVWQLDGVAEKQ